MDAIKRTAVPVTIALMCALSGWPMPAGAQTTTDYLDVRPGHGPPGTQVKVEGHFGGFLGCIDISFDDADGTVAGWGRFGPGNFYLVRHIPAGAVLGDGQVRVVGRGINPGTHSCTGLPTGSLATTFTVTNGPGIFAFSPHRGPVGTRVTIDGVGFNSATEVLFHGVRSKYTIVSDAEIMARVPSGAKTGQIRMVMPGATIGSGPSFTVT